MVETDFLVTVTPHEKALYPKTFDVRFITLNTNVYIVGFRIQAKVQNFEKCLPLNYRATGFPRKYRHSDKIS